jgi:hypothetical protein
MRTGRHDTTAARTSRCSGNSAERALLFWSRRLERSQARDKPAGWIQGQDDTHVIRARLVMGLDASAECGIVAPRDNRINQPITAAVRQIRLTEPEDIEIFPVGGQGQVKSHLVTRRAGGAVIEVSTIIANPDLIDSDNARHHPGASRRQFHGMSWPSECVSPTVSCSE